MELVLSFNPCSRKHGLEEMHKLREACPELAFQLEKLQCVAERCTLSIPEDRPRAAEVLQSLNNDLHTTEVPEVRSAPLLIESHIDDHDCW
jgi:hypothetical protein